MSCGQQDVLNALQVHHGLIWVWAGTGPEAFIESAATPIVTCPDLEDQDPLDPGMCPAVSLFWMTSYLRTPHAFLPSLSFYALHLV